MINLLFKNAFKKNQLLVTAVLVVGFVLTAVLMFETGREIQRQEKAVFADEKNHIRDSIADQLRAASETLHNVTVLFTVSASEVDSDGFRMIAEATLAQQRAVRSISFSRWVPFAQKTAFEEKSWQASGVAHFEIHTDATDLPQPPQYYLPMVYLEPLTPTTISHLGYDLWSQKKFRDHLQRAIDSGETVICGGLLDANHHGFTLNKAVYTGKIAPHTMEQRRKSVLGVLRVFVSSPELMRSLANYRNFKIRLTAKDSKVVVEKKQIEGRRSFLDMELVDHLPLIIANVNYSLEIHKFIPFTAARAGIYFLVFLLGASISVLIAYRLFIFLRTQREFLESQARIERKVEEKTKALQQSEVLLRQVINSNPNVIFAQNKDGQILFANQTFFNFFECSEEEVYNSLLTFPLPGQGLARGFVEEKVALKNGRTIWFESHKVDIELEHHGLCSLIVAVDISQRKLDNALIAEQRAKMVASAKLSALGEMAGGIAHEINTPLTTLQLCSDFISDVLQERAPDLESIQEQNEVIAKTTERIGKIVSGLRTFSKDGSRDEMKRFCLVQVIENTLALCREKFRHSAIRLIWDPQESIQIVGREVQISQVILNLLNNSFDAVQGIKDPWIRIRLNEKNGDVEISVEDNGYGVSVTARERLFHPFFTTKASDKGTGLGLSISKGIVEIHSGKLQLDTESRYTRFVIRLPKQQPLRFLREQGNFL